MGTVLTSEDVDEMKKNTNVINCLGGNARKIGGADGDYYSNPGEVVIWKKCPRDFAFYIMDDDFDAGVMQVTITMMTMMAIMTL